MSATPPRGIVTPEAVVLEFETASVGSRSIAMVLDVLLQAVVLWLLIFALALGSEAVGSTVVIILVVIMVFLVLFGYPAAMETLWNGRTLGKAALGLRVVTREGAPIRFRHAAIRTIFGLVDFWLLFGSVAVLTIILTRRNQRLGDLVAGTIVLRERTAAGRTVAVTFPPPPGYESYTASLDVSALRPEQYAVIRSFLMRVFELTPGARVALAVRLANPTAMAMHHRPPPTVPPEVFLACVAAAYQQRHALAGASSPYSHPAPTWGAPPLPPSPTAF